MSNYTPEQLARVKESGEEAADFNQPYGWSDAISSGPYGLIAAAIGQLPAVRKLQANARAGVARIPSDIVMLGASAPSLVKSGYEAATTDRTFGDSLGTNMFGDEAIAQAGIVGAGKLRERLKALPANQRTRENVDKIQEDIKDDPEVRAALEAGANPVLRGSKAVSNAINESQGLGPVDKETSTDTAIQTIAQSLIPMGGPSALGTKLVEGAASGATRSTLKAILATGEALIPGTVAPTAGRVALNAGVGVGVDQGIRYASGQPSIGTGDAFAAEQLAYSEPEAYEDDDIGALDTEDMMKGSAVLGAAVVGAAVATGKTRRILSQAVEDAVDDSLKNGDVNAPKVFEPQLTAPQRAKADAVSGTAPLSDIIRKANLPKDVEKEAVDDMERAAHSAQSSSVQAAFSGFKSDGRLQGLDIPTHSLDEIRTQFDGLKTEDLDLLSRGLTAKNVIDRRTASMTDLTEEVNKLRNDLAVHRRQGGYGTTAGREIANEMDRKIRVKSANLKKMQDDVDGTRGEVESLTNKQAFETAREFDANPQLKKIEGMFRKVYNDVMQAKVNLGQVDKAEAIKTMQRYPNYMAMLEDDMAGKSFGQKMWMTLKDKGAIKEQGVRTNSTPLNARDVDPNAPRVQTPQSPADALAAYVIDHIQFTTRNDAVRTFARTTENTAMDGRAVSVFKAVDGKSSIRVSDPNIKKFMAAANADKHVVTYVDQGQMHAIRVADPEVARGLMFNSPATLGIFNTSRKVWQQGTTGAFAPWFAIKGALYDSQAINVNRQTGRSFGMIDATLRKALPNSTAIDAILSRVSDPTQYLQQVTAIFNAVSSQAMKNIGQEIGQDLAKRSGFWSGLAKMTGGEEMIARLGTTMVKAHNDSLYGAFVRADMGRTRFMDDPFTTVRSDFSDMLKDFPMSGAVKDTRAALANAYLGTLEAVHNSGKFAFFAQNVSVLEAKYGKGKVPKKEMDKLAYETKTSSGDMAAVAGSPFFQKTYSSVPYSQITVSATAKFMKQLSTDWDHVLPRIFTGVGLPVATSIYIMGQNEETSDWYWNKLPTWERMSTIPVVKPEWWFDYLNGDDKPVKSTDVTLMPIAPELIPIVSPFIAGLRSLGVLGPTAEANSDFRKEAGAALATLTGIAMPPGVNWFSAMTGDKVDPAGVIASVVAGSDVQSDLFQENRAQGLNSEMNNADSPFTRRFTDGMVALFGQAAGLAISTYDVFQDTADNADETYLSAARNAFDYGTYEVERRIPAVPGTESIRSNMWTGGKRRTYVSTPEADKVRTVVKEYEKFAFQRSVENNDERAALMEQFGIEEIPKIKDKNAREMLETIHSTLAQGDFKKTNEVKADLNALIATLESSKDKMKPDEYHARKNDLTIRVQKASNIQFRLIEGLEAQLKKKYGGGLEQALQYITKNTGR